MKEFLTFYDKILEIRKNMIDQKNFKNILNSISRNKRLNGKKIVFNTVRSNESNLDREVFLGKMFAMNGAEVKILLDDGILPHWDTFKFDQIKLKKIEHISLNPLIAKKFFKKIVWNKKLKYRKKLYSDKNLQFMNYSDIIHNLNSQNLKNLDKFAKSSTIRFFKNSELNFQNKTIKYYYNLSLINALISKKIGRFIKNTLKPDYFITSHGIYSTWGPAFEYLKKNKIKSLVYAGKHSHSLKNKDIYFSDTKIQKLSNSIFWKRFKNISLNDKMKLMVKNYFETRIKHNTKDTSVYFNNNSKKFKIDKNDGYNYHIAIFPSSIWDGNIIDRHKAFDGIVNWLFKTIQFFKNNNDVKIYLRFHPAEISFFKNSARVGDLIKDKIPNLENYPNVCLIEPEDRIDTYDFLQSGIDLGICYDGILALELVYLKIPVVLAGVGGRFSVPNGNYTIKCQKDYFSYLEDIKKTIADFNENYPKYIDNIFRYTYWYIFENPFELPTLSIEKISRTDISNIKKQDIKLPNRIYKIFQ